MGILFTILMGIWFTITIGILFTIVLGIQFTISTPFIYLYSDIEGATIKNGGLILSQKKRFSNFFTSNETDKVY